MAPHSVVPRSQAVQHKSCSVLLGPNMSAERWKRRSLRSVFVCVCASAGAAQGAGAVAHACASAHVRECERVRARAFSCARVCSCVCIGVCVCAQINPYLEPHQKTAPKKEKHPDVATT